MFCTQCGSPLPEHAKFCMTCGAPVVVCTPRAASAPTLEPDGASAPAPEPEKAPSTDASSPAPAMEPVLDPAPDSVEMLPSFARDLSARLDAPMDYIPELGAYHIVTKRFTAALANLHQHFFVSAYDAAGYAEMQAYTKACSEWALNNYQGALRGLQKGVVIYAVLLQHPLRADAMGYTKELPKKHFAAFDVPVLVDPVTGTCEMLEKTPVWGFAMWKGIKRAAREALAL